MVFQDKLTASALHCLRTHFAALIIARGILTSENAVLAQKLVESCSYTVRSYIIHVAF